MSFVDAVQTGAVKGPQQRAYSEAKWRAGYDAHSDLSMPDQRLFEAGLWFAERFSSARRAWHSMPRLPLERTAIARMLVGVTNFHTAHAHPALPSQSGDKATDFSAFAGYMRDASDLSERIQHAIDSLRVPLANALEGLEPDGTECSATDRLSLLGEVSNQLILGQQYAGLERLWSQCLWDRWYVEKGKFADVLTPSDAQREGWRAATQVRQSSLQIEMAHRSLDAWRRASRAERLAWAGQPAIVNAKRHGKRLRFDIGTVDLGLDTPPSTWQAALISSEQYFESLIDQPLPEMEGLSVRELLLAFWCLAPLCHLLDSDALRAELLQDIGEVHACAPRIHRDDLASAIQRALNVPTEKAHAVLRALQCDGSSRDEVWLKPLVPLDGSWLTLVFEPLRSANLRWATDAWLNRGGLDMSSRGPAFETLLRSELARSTKLPNAVIVPDAVSLRSGDVKEEIDLVVRVGSTIVIGEAKCSIYPTEPYDHATYERILAGGAAQATRKAAFVRANLTAFLQQRGWDELQPHACSVLPVVVSNLALGAAMPGAGASITDIYILRRFLAEGRLPIYGTLEPDGTTRAMNELELYSSPQEAEHAIGPYLANPPQLSILLAEVSIKTRPLIRFDGEPAAEYVVVHTDAYDALAKGFDQSKVEQS